MILNNSAGIIKTTELLKSRYFSLVAGTGLEPATQVMSPAGFTAALPQIYGGARLEVELSRDF